MPGKYPTPRGEAATRAKRKYDAENYEFHRLVMKKGTKQQYQDAANKMGVSLSRWLVLAAEEFLKGK